MIPSACWFEEGPPTPKGGRPPPWILGGNKKYRNEFAARAPIKFLGPGVSLRPFGRIDAGSESSTIQGFPAETGSRRPCLRAFCPESHGVERGDREGRRVDRSPGLDPALQRQ